LPIPAPRLARRIMAEAPLRFVSARARAREREREREREALERGNKFISETTIGGRRGG